MRELFEDLESSREGFNPMESARRGMRPELPRRFYTNVEAVAGEGGHGIALDGKLVRSPGGTALALPTREGATLVAEEFSAQGERMDPRTMPVWRLVNTAMDGVVGKTQPVIDDIVRFAGTDLLCYRADAPQELVRRQSQQWDPILAWVRQATGARFVLAEGVMHVEQPGDTIAAIEAHLVRDADPLRVAALHLMTSLTGSALIALATGAGHLTPEAAWAAAHVDEDWNIEQWGADPEAEAMRKARWRDFEGAVRLTRTLS